MTAAAIGKVFAAGLDAMIGSFKYTGIGGPRNPAFHARCLDFYSLARQHKRHENDFAIISR